MKTIFFACLACFVMAAPAFSELPPQDLDKIRLTIREEIAESETRMITEIAKSEARMKEYIDLKIEGVETKIEGVDKRMNLVVGFVSGLIILIVATVGIPQIIMSWRGRKDNTLERKIEALTREVETLKQQRIVNP